MSDIVERLRGKAKGLQVWIDENDFVEFGYRPEGLKREQTDYNEAADLIESQAQHIAQLEAALEVADAGRSHANELLSQKSERVRELEAERDELKRICRDAYEVWAGSEGIPRPETAAEAYLLQLLEQMRDEVKRGLKGQT